MSKEILSSLEIEKAITRITHEILEKNSDSENLCLVGIQRGGVILAERLASKIKSIDEIGSLDISLYRDDIYIKDVQPVLRSTDIPYSINDKTVVLVDDVLFTGRTTRAAMDALTDFGRPAKIQLAVLVDRGHRELPIRADYVGKNIPTSLGDRVDVILNVDKTDEDSVAIVKESK
jgi:pyrimidine operon attenuation protein/uracil phosphoribosyltransferase